MTSSPQTQRAPRTQTLPSLLSLAVGASSLLLSGCGLAIKEGAQHAHFLPESKLEVHTAMQLDMLPEPLHAKACADTKMLYDVTVLGTAKSLSRGERAAVLEALNGMEGKADVFYLTRSWGTLDDRGRNCGEVWGRGIRLRLRDSVPATARAAETAVVVTPATAAPAPAPQSSPGDKAKMGF